MASCCWKPKVKNLKGELVESKLFNDLLSFTQNRQKSKEYYVIGKNQEFLNEVSDDTKFDLNGEITFNSLRKEANLDIKEEEIINKLNKDLGSGEYPFDEAISKMLNFNENSSMREDFMATISIDDKNKVILEVVKNTPENQNKLVDTIKARTLLDRLRYYLLKHNVNVSFIDSNVNGRYSTENAERTADGLYNLIQIAHGERGEEALAEETGHFIIGAMGDHPLVSRLISLLTDDAMKKLLGESKYIESVGSKNPKREAAGYLVGEALKKNLDKGVIGTLIDRIIGVAKRMFYKLKRDDVAYLKSLVEDIAFKIANGAINEKFEVSVDNALKTKETLYSAPDTKKVENFKKIVKKLQTLVLLIRAFDPKSSKKFQDLYEYVSSGKIINSPGSVLADALAYEGIVNLLRALPEELLSISDKVAAMDLSYSGLDHDKAVILRLARILLDNTYDIREIIKELLVPGYNSFALGTPEYKELYKLLGILNQVLGDTDDRVISLNDVLKVKEEDFYTKFLEKQLGTNYVTRAKRKVFKLGRGSIKLVTLEESLESIKEALRYLKDESKISSVLTSMSNSPSLTNNIVDKMFRLFKKIANDSVLEIKNELSEMQAELERIGGRTEEFFERAIRDGDTVRGDAKGELTGNIIDEYLYGVLELEYEELVRAEKENFNKNVDKSGKTRELIAAMWLAYFKPIRRQFFETRFTLSSDGTTFIPVDKYKNQYYIDHIKGTEKEKWLNRYKALKERIDRDCLGYKPEDSAKSLRAPLFKGWSIQRIKNRSVTMSTKSAFKNTFWEIVSETFTEDSEDRDFGDRYTYNPDEQLYTDEELYEEDKIHRVPLFGINKLKDMNALSTDLFQSTLAYSSMAYRYRISSQMASVLEVGREVIKRTDYGRKVNKTGEMPKLRSLDKFERFVDKELYGFRTYKVSLGKWVLNKIVSFCTSVGAHLFLGGNVTGGVVNVGTGALEIFKEAFAGEHFDLASWRRANKEYFKYIVPNMLDAGALRKYDRISLFIEYFDTLNQSEERAFDFNTKKGRLWRLNPFGDNLFLPYKAGEHYMLTLTFLSVAMSTKLYDAQGNETTVYDALGEEDIEGITDKNGKVKGKRLVLKGNYVFKKEDIPTFKMIESISNTLNDAITKNMIPTYTLEQLDFFRLNNIDANWPNKKIFGAILEIRGKIAYSTFREGELINKCREINNRLHGIYNSQDKASIQLNFIMNALFSMRNYAFGMINRRFGTSHYNLALGTEVEGSILTVAKVLANTSAFGELSIWKTLRFLTLPFTDKSKSMMLSLGFSANQVSNMRRNFADCAIIGILWMLKLLTAKSGDDDDEEELYTGIAYYFTSRLLREQAAFNTPQGLVAELPVITNIEPAGMSAILSLLEIAELEVEQAIGSEDAYYKSSSDTYKEGDSKAWYKILRLLPFYRSWLLMLNPYRAAESYEFGRANKTR